MGRNEPCELDVVLRVLAHARAWSPLRWRRKLCATLNAVSARASHSRYSLAYHARVVLLVIPMYCSD